MAGRARGGVLRGGRLGRGPCRLDEDYPRRRRPDRDGWATALAEASIAVEADGARDRTTGIAIDILFPGDDWEMVIPLPEPAQVREYDDDLGAWFIAPAPLAAVKTAVYLSKLAEYGEELAAKDLTDVVELLRADQGRAAAILAEAPSEVAPALRRIWKNVRGR